MAKLVSILKRPVHFLYQVKLVIYLKKLDITVKVQVDDKSILTKNNKWLLILRTNAILKIQYH